MKDIDKKRENKKAVTAERLFEEYGYQVPEFHGWSTDISLIRERVHNAEKFNSRICFVRENVKLLKLVRARMEEMGVTQADVAHFLQTDKSNLWRFFTKGTVGALSQAKYLLLLELLGIQVKMSFSIVEKFDRKERYGEED